MSDKIQPNHLDRTAYVYIRQSTMHQVRFHKESQRLQYNLQHRARDLGFTQVKVIDDDLGRSGSGSQQRPGFDRLIAAVCRGEVGAVLAIEASRLARNNRDWHHLIDLCAMTKTLVIDHDGTYDPCLVNDRLLLGLKGTMSEFELNLWRQRAQEALRQMIQRGEVLFRPPIGYVRTEDNGIEMIADRQVQDAISGVFIKFDERGSVRQVLLWYCENKLPLPTLSIESGNHDIVWRLPVYNRVHSILTNPLYAGAFVYGRRCTRTKIVEGRARKTRGHSLPQDQWQVVIKDHHAAYISWETFVANQKKITSNLPRHHEAKGAGTGAAKSGSALLAGLLRCARCGRKLHVGYSGNRGVVPRYYCRGAHINHGAKRCISFGGLRPDRHVVEQVLDALQPTGIESAIDAWEKMQQKDSQKQRALQLALDKAQYEVSRARRQFDAVDPENRLVAAELEHRWNQALQYVGELETRLDEMEQQREQMTDHEHQRLMAMGDDLHQLWHHPSASPTIKKRILRTVLQEIIVDLSDEPSQIQMQLHWVGGVHSPLTMVRNRTGQHRRCTDRKVVDLVCELVQVSNDGSIAAILNRLGYRTGAGNTWTQSRVKTLRKHHKIPPHDPETNRDRLTLEQAAKTMKVSPPVIRRLIAQSILPARQVVRHAPWVIKRDDLDLPAVQTAVKAVHQGQLLPQSIADQSQVLLFQQSSEV